MICIYFFLQFIGALNLFYPFTYPSLAQLQSLYHEVSVGCRSTDWPPIVAVFDSSNFRIKCRLSAWQTTFISS